MNMEKRFKAHPWHGISAGESCPRIVNVYVEIVPTDTVKYEADKSSGYLKIDRPQKYSNQSPALYGFIPQTYCGTRIARRCMDKTGREAIVGDGDPLDICVLTEKPITHGDILVSAVPVGGFRMIDKLQADDKIIAVLYEDSMYGSFTELKQLPPAVVDRLRHYFLTYKDFPGETSRKVEIAEIYDAQEARAVITESRQDYMLDIVGGSMIV